MKSNRTLAIVAIAIMVSLSAVAWNAQATSARLAAQPVAVATVDIVKIIDGLEEREVLEKDLQIRTDARQNQLNEVLERLQILSANLEESGDRTSDDYKEQVRQFYELRAVAEARREALTQIISIDLGTVRREMFLKVSDAIGRIAEREGYDIVMLDDSLFPLPENAADADVYRAIITKSIIYRKDSVDITDDVVILMNNEFTAP
jgi:Skp family chaperone for outer membrane proteins